MGRLAVSRVGSIALAFAALACSGADWHQLAVVPGYVSPRYVDIRLSTGSWSPIDREARDAFVQALMDELSDRGIEVRPWQDRGPRSPLTVFLDIVGYDEGNQAERWACGSFGCGEGVMIAVVNVEGTSLSGPLLTGTVEGWVRSGFFGGSSLTAANEAGEAIACIIARGSASRCGGLSRSAQRERRAGR